MFKNHEVYCGFDLVEFNRVRDVLDAAGIKHRVKVDNIGATRLRGGSPIAGGVGASAVGVGNGNGYDKQYYIYVSKADYDLAIAKIMGKVK